LAIIDFLNAGVSVKFKIFLGRHALCVNGCVVYRQDPANTTCPVWIFGMKDIADIQITNERLAI